jgi:hypothetical protein
MISLAIDVQRMNSMRGVQIIISTLKLKPPPKSERAATRTQLRNWGCLAITY